jgi:hypothetical protein
MYFNVYHCIFVHKIPVILLIIIDRRTAETISHNIRKFLFREKTEAQFSSAHYLHTKAQLSNHAMNTMSNFMAQISSILTLYVTA